MEKYFISIADCQINVVDWEIANPKAILIVVHGYAEHSQRYEHVAEFFNKAGFFVRSFDLRGHGKSDGLPGHIDDFSTFVDELEHICELSKKQFTNIPLFVLAHSMGGVVAGIAAAKSKLAGIQNLILSNPGLDIISFQPKILVSLIRLLSKVAPKIQTKKLSNEFISRDAEVRSKYDSDPLNYRGGARPGFANEFDKAGQWLLANAHLISQNLYLNYSLTDKVVNPKASEIFYESVGSKDKSKTHYDGLYHELLNEPEQLEVMANILNWCMQRIH